MRIAYLLTTLAMGGAERQALELARQMSLRGHTIIVVSLGPAVAAEWLTELPVTRLGIDWSPVKALTGLARARLLLRGFAPDAVHSHCVHPNLFARLQRLTGVPGRVISTVHNVYEGPWPRLLAYRLTDRLADQVTFVSRAAADRYVAARAVSPAKTVVVTNGFDTESFHPDEERRRRMRAAMDAGEGFVWLSAGRLTEAKDFPNLLRAFATVCALRPEAQLWIAGEGSVDYTEGLKRLAIELGLTRRVRWLGLRRDMAALLDAADGFVLGSAWEGMPLVIGEAMAMARPVVATDVGGVREIVGEAGRLVPSRNPEALAQAMTATMEMSADERRQLGERARERIVSGFSLEARVAEWEQLYRATVEMGR
jgi:glycosyltransferase involved in cell wall biosynthesis